MPRVKVWIDKNAFSEEVLKGSGIKAVLQDAADKTVANAGEEYEAEVKVGARRATARVKPGTAHAFYSNRKHNTLLKAVGSVKL